MKTGPPATCFLFLPPGTFLSQAHCWASSECYSFLADFCVGASLLRVSASPCLSRIFSEHLMREMYVVPPLFMSYFRFGCKQFAFAPFHPIIILWGSFSPTRRAYPAPSPSHPCSLACSTQDELFHCTLLNAFRRYPRPILLVPQNKCHRFLAGEESAEVCTPGVSFHGNKIRGLGMGGVSRTSSIRTSVHAG